MINEFVTFKVLESACQYFGCGTALGMGPMLGRAFGGTASNSGLVRIVSSSIKRLTSAASAATTISDIFVHFGSNVEADFTGPFFILANRS